MAILNGSAPAACRNKTWLRHRSPGRAKCVAQNVDMHIVLRLNSTPNCWRNIFSCRPPSSLKWRHHARLFRYPQSLCAARRMTDHGPKSRLLRRSGQDIAETVEKLRLNKLLFARAADYHVPQLEGNMRLVMWPSSAVKFPPSYEREIHIGTQVEKAGSSFATGISPSAHESCVSSHRHGGLGRRLESIIGHSGRFAGELSDRHCHRDAPCSRT